MNELLTYCIELASWPPRGRTTTSCTVVTTHRIQNAFEMSHESHAQMPCVQESGLPHVIHADERSVIIGRYEFSTLMVGRLGSRLVKEFISS